MKLRTFLRVLPALLATCLAAPPALANEPWPSKPVRLVIGFSPGGSNDIVARLMAPKLGELLGQQVVVENRPGAGGNLAAQAVLAAPADGHTVMICTTGTLSIQPHMAKMPFNPETDLVPVTQIANAPYVLMLHNSIPARNVKELVAYAKQNPGKLNFASSGTATGAHLAGEMFKVRAGVDMVHIPYKGTGQAMADLLSGQVSMMFDQPVSSMQYAKSGQLRPIAVAHSRRLPAFPDLPTVAESGYPDFEPVTWTGICAAKGTPPAAIERLQRDVAKVLAMPEIRQRLVQDGLEPVGSTPEKFREFLAADKRKWGTTIKAANIKAD